MNQPPALSVIQVLHDNSALYAPNGDPSLVPPPNDALFRLGLLIVGFPRHPFSIQVTKQHSTLRQLRVALFADISHTISKTEYSHSFKSIDLNLRFFRALLPRKLDEPDAPQRYLCLGDADTIALVEMRDEAVRATYLTAANEIGLDDDLPTFLASLPTQKWTPQESLEEIQVLVVMGATTPWYAPTDDGPKMTIFRSAAPPRSQMCYGGDMDRRFHFFDWWPEMKRMPVLWAISTEDDELLNQVPYFDHIQITRQLCKRPLHWHLPKHNQSQMTMSEDHETRLEKTVQAYREMKEEVWAAMNPPYSPPRLSKLAEDVIFHSLLSSAPHFIDPVDCVVECSLVEGETVVVENALCFVKFQLNERPTPSPGQWGQSVNPRMLDVLRKVGQTGDPSRPQLLLIISLGTDKVKLESARLPTDLPTIIAAASWLVCFAVDEPLTYLGNAREEDIYEYRDDDPHLFASTTF